MNYKLISGTVVFCMVVVATKVYAETKQERLEAAQYEDERQAADRKIKRLESYEKPAKIVKRTADASVRKLEKITGIPGRSVGYVYRGVTDAIMDPQAEEKQRAIRTRREQEYREYQEKQRRDKAEFNRLQEQQNRQIQKGINRVSQPAGKP